MLSGVLRHQQCSCAWVKLRGWQPWRHISLNIPASAKGHPKPVVASSFMSLSDKKWVLMNTSSSKCPRWGVPAWGSTDNPSEVPWETCHQCPGSCLAEEIQESRRKAQGTLVCPHLEVSVICLQNLYLYLELFHSYHLFSLSVYGKTLFKPCKINLVFNVLDVPGWVLVRYT